MKLIWTYHKNRKWMGQTLRQGEMIEVDDKGGAVLLRNPKWQKVGEKAGKAESKGKQGKGDKAKKGVGVDIDGDGKVDITITKEEDGEIDE